MQLCLKLLSRGEMALAGSGLRLAAVLLLCAAACEAALDWDRTTIDITDSLDGGKANGEFVCRNTGRQDVRILRARATCSCLEIVPSQNVISPGGTLRVKFHFDGGRRQGRMTSRAYITTDDPHDRVAVLRVTADLGTGPGAGEPDPAGGTVWSIGEPCSQRTFHVPAPGGARFEGPPSVELDSGIFRLVEQELDPAGSAVIAAVAPASTAEPAEAKLSVRGVADGREVERTIVLRIVDPAYPFGRDADAMTRCLRAGNAKAVANLLRHDPSLINRPSRCCTRMLPLAVAAKTGNIDCIRLLLDNGADVDARSGAHERTALHAAALSGRVEAIRLLLGAEADAAALDRWEMTPLHCAAWGARPECGEAAKLLLDSGAPGDAWTAAGLGRLAELTALIEADPALLSKSDSRGRRLLHWAAFRGRDAVVSTILEQKRETESRDSEGRTPLMCAASQGHSSTVALLLAAGAELRATDRLQRTALHWAAVFDRAPTAAVLLDAGAPPDAKDRMERTPVELAEQNGSRRALAVLRERLSTGDKHGSSTGNGTGPIQVPGTGPETQPPDDRVD